MTLGNLVAAQGGPLVPPFQGHLSNLAKAPRF